MKVQNRTCDGRPGGKVHGGGRVKQGVPKGGVYVRPAVVEIPYDAPIVQQETFAPILYVMRYQSLDEAIASRGFRRLFSAKRLKEYRDSFHELKGNRQVCATTVGLPQSLLLAPRSDMDQILEAIRKIHKHSVSLVGA